MNKYNFSLKCLILLLSLTTPALFGANNLVPLKIIKVQIDQTTQKVFEKPAGLKQEYFLLRLLNETALTQKIDNKKLKIYANTIRELCKKNSAILKTNLPKLEIAPLEYSLEHCYPLIDEVFISLLNTGYYKPRSKKERKNTEIRALNTSKRLVGEINKKIAPLELLKKGKISEKNKTKLGTFHSIDNNFYDWYMSYKKQDSETLKLTIKIYNKEEKLGYMKYTLKTKDYLSIDIDYIYVEEPFRQHSFAATMLLTAIGLAQSFGTETKISLIALPMNNLMKAVLTKYYKSFGFIPSKNIYFSLSMHIDNNGKIFKAYEIARKENIQKQLSVYKESIKNIAKCLSVGSGMVLPVDITKDIKINTDIKYNDKYGDDHQLSHTLLFTLNKIEDQNDKIGKIEIDYKPALNTFYIADLVIKNEYMHSGLGSLLVAITIFIAKRLAKGKGSKISLIPYANPYSMQSTLIKFYQAFGFGEVKENGRQELYIDKGGNLFKKIENKE